MILNRRINLIWYGRGILETECDAFALFDNATVSAAISEVYCVTDPSSNATFEENTWKTSKPSQLAGFTHLKCGNLYVVVLNDQQTIDIPEAVVVHGGDSVNPADIVSVLPNNDGGTDPEPEPEPTGDCIPSGYTALIITTNQVGSYECSIGGETNTITTTMDLVNDTKIYYKGTLTPAGDDTSSFNFKVSGNDNPIMTWVGFATLEFTSPIYFESATLGCYKSTEDNQASATELIFAKVETDEPADEPADEPDTTVTQLTCFADGNVTGDWTHKMIYTAPAGSTSETQIERANIQVLGKGTGILTQTVTDTKLTVPDVADTITQDDVNAIHVVNQILDVADAGTPKSKHSFCMYFSTFQNVSADFITVGLVSKTQADGGLYEGDIDFVTVDAGTPGGGNNGNTQNLHAENVSFKVFVGETDSAGTCINPTEDGGVSSFNF
tara:strand:- start:159 stop:1481 length:1323 start_codon:yes stop_codon:yes gene_type:complete